MIYVIHPHWLRFRNSNQRMGRWKKPLDFETNVLRSKLPFDVPMTLNTMACKTIHLRYADSKTRIDSFITHCSSGINT